MGLFRRAPRSRFPADMLSWLETFGRYSLDYQHSGIDGFQPWDLFGSLHEYATSDREGFLTELQAIVAEDRGGFATLGAARVCWEMYSGECLQIPEALPLIDAGINFKLARDLPTMSLTGYEMQRFVQIREQGLSK